MNIPQKHKPALPDEPDANIADLMPYIRAAKGKFPSKEELFAEVNRERDNRKSLVRSIQASIVLAIMFVGIWTINPTISTKTYSTAYAKNEQFVLPDGSKVHLNSNTTLSANFRLFSREMYLEQGEASFEVQHGLRPFTVTVNASTVLDIGTIFNISNWGQAFITTVIKGEVEVQTGGDKRRLIAGQSLQVEGTQAGQAYAANMDMVTAWQAGKIIFNKTPLKDAVASIQRYRQQPIHLDPSVEKMQITGIYDLRQIEQLLDSMDSMFAVKVTRLDDGAINIQKN